jgi:hypothetical protein
MASVKTRNGNVSEALGIKIPVFQTVLWMNRLVLHGFENPRLFNFPF